MEGGPDKEGTVQHRGTGPIPLRPLDRGAPGRGCLDAERHRRHKPLSRGSRLAGRRRSGLLPRSRASRRTCSPGGNLALRRGVRLKAVPAEGGRLPSVRMAEAVGPHTRVIAAAKVSYSPGFIADLAPLKEARDRHGAFLVVDAAQSGRCAQDRRGRDGRRRACGGHAEGAFGVFRNRIPLLPAGGGRGAQAGGPRPPRSGLRRQPGLGDVLAGRRHSLRAGRPAFRSRQLQLLRRGGRRCRARHARSVRTRRDRGALPGAFAAARARAARVGIAPDQWLADAPRFPTSSPSGRSDARASGR